MCWHRLAIALAAVCALIAVVPAATPAQQSAPAAPKTIEPVRFAIAIKNRKVDTRTVRVKQGDLLEITFMADERVELHLHGYDKLVTVEPTAPAVLRLDARIAGRFSIEAHKFGGGNQHKGGHTALLYLEVYPR